MLLGNEIAAIKEQITEIKNVPNVSQAILREYAQITTELINLRKANENYDELQRLKRVAADYAATRDTIIADELLAIESTVNQEMGNITLEILGEAEQVRIQHTKRRRYRSAVPRSHYL